MALNNAFARQGRRFRCVVKDDLAALWRRIRRGGTLPAPPPGAKTNHRREHSIGRRLCQGAPHSCARATQQKCQTSTGRKDDCRAELVVETAEFPEPRVTLECRTNLSCRCGTIERRVNDNEPHP